MRHVIIFDGHHINFDTINMVSKVNTYTGVDNKPSIYSFVVKLNNGEINFSLTVDHTTGDPNILKQRVVEKRTQLLEAINNKRDHIQRMQSAY